MAGQFTKQMANNRGMSMISTIIAMGIIVTSIGAITFPAMQLHKAMKKAELANLAVVIEANLISAFHNKANFSDIALNDVLRAGNFPAAIPIATSFTTLSLVPDVTGTEAIATGFLERNLTGCAAYSNTCVLRYEVRLRKTGAATYAFSYQIDANPAFIVMAPLGDVTSYTSPVDPGLYRAEVLKTNCNPATDLFMNGMNRDTGEAFCVEKPLADRCPDRHLPKGLIFETYTANPKAGVLKIECSPLPMRTYRCEPNFAIQSFQPSWVDQATTAAPVPGTCVFRTAATATMPVTLPANPTSPYIRSMSGTMCPPYYAASNAGSCQLVPNNARNASAEGMGRCASQASKNCTRNTYTQVSDGGAAFATWTACNLAPPPLPATCGPAPANPVYTYPCSGTQVSTLCNGVVNSGPTCATTAPAWSGGELYAVGVYNYAPTASANASFSGRQMTCGFTDTSPPCTAPEFLFDGSTYGRKNAKWFGGVRASGTTCTLDPSLVPSQTMPATNGG